MRSRHQEGWVEERGSRLKRWYGHYFIYIRDEAGSEKRHHVGVSLGEKSRLRKWEAEQELRKIITAATGSQPRKDGGVTFDWFTRERFIPMREGNWRPATKRGICMTLRVTSFRCSGPCHSRTWTNSTSLPCSIGWPKSILSQ